MGAYIYFGLSGMSAVLVPFGCFVMGILIGRASKH